MTIEEMLGASVITLKPGDRLLLRVPDCMTREQMRELQEMWRATNPDIPATVITGADVLVLRSEDAD